VNQKTRREKNTNLDSTSRAFVRMLLINTEYSHPHDMCTTCLHTVIAANIRQTCTNRVNSNQSLNDHQGTNGNWIGDGESRRLLEMGRVAEQRESQNEIKHEIMRVCCVYHILACHLRPVSIR
jgi:hypothetical protein